MNDEELSYLWKISKIMLLSKYTFIVSDTLKVHHFRTFKSTPLDA